MEGRREGGGKVEGRWKEEGRWTEGGRKVDGRWGKGGKVEDRPKRFRKEKNWEKTPNKKNQYPLRLVGGMGSPPVTPRHDQNGSVAHQVELMSDYKR
jgi:hypothetical protein